MKIRLTKDSDQQHTLEVVRSDGSREAIDLVTREALFHDLVHFAVESTLPTQEGFWGTLAKGKTMADLNDRSGESVREYSETLMLVEGIVGVMSGLMDMSEDQAFEKLQWFSETQGQEPPDWCTREFVAAVLEIVRQLRGRWKATPYGNSMEIDWAEA